MRIQKAMAYLGLGSRRHCETLVADGRVTLDGRTLGIGESVEDGEIQRLCLDGRPVGEMPGKRYLLLNKAAGYVTTVSDPQGRPTVMDLLPADAVVGEGRVYPVGRLDRDTLGVLLFTNDGEMAHRLLHPSSGVEKEYLATVEGKVTREKLEQLKQGPILNDGPTRPPRSVTHSGRQIRLVIKEGRKRQVKRMLKQVGLDCVGLERLRFGNLEAGDLPRGAFRELTGREILELKKLCP